MLCHKHFDACSNRPYT